MKIGIYQSYWGAVGGGQRYVAVAAELLAQTHDVEIVHHRPDFDRAHFEEAMQVDLSRIGFRCIPALERPQPSSRNPLARLRLEAEFGRDVSSPYELFINNSDTPPIFNHAGRGVLIVHFPLVSFDEFHARNTPGWANRPAPVRYAADLYQRREWRKRFETYDTYVANSQYGQQWVARRWGIRAEVLYPPLRQGLAPSAKLATIVSIGAIRSEQHKKQSVLVDAFKRLCDEGLSGWRYIIIGATGKSSEDRQALQDLRQAIEGYPIELRPDASGADLKSTLESASILWHSMGFGVDQEREPGRLEHFGMVATEAMAAGCLPVAFNGGGLPESVVHGETGWLWSTPDDLRRYTRAVADDAERREAMSRAAVARAATFGTEAFRARFESLVAPLLREHAGRASAR